MKVGFSGTVLTSVALGLCLSMAGCQNNTAATTPLTSKAADTATGSPPSTPTPAINISTSLVATTTPPPLVTLPGDITVITRWQYAVRRFTNTLIFDPPHKGKLFQISGRITKIARDQAYMVVNDDSLPSVFTYSSDWICYFQTDDSQLAGLKEGQTVTVQGVWGWGTRALGTKESDPVYLDNCNLIG